MNDLGRQNQARKAAVAVTWVLSWPLSKLGWLSCALAPRDRDSEATAQGNAQADGSSNQLDVGGIPVARVLEASRGRQLIGHRVVSHLDAQRQ